MIHNPTIRWVRWVPVVLAVLIVVGVIAFNQITHVPDLPLETAKVLVSRAPEFNRYAQLVKVEDVFHAKDSMDSASYGRFTFRYFKSPPDAPPIEARADFQYWDGTWHLSQFDYGCPSDCHDVLVYNAPPKHD